MTRDPMGALLNDVIAVPVTTRARGLTTEVSVGPEDGIRKVSVANLDWVHSVPKSWLVRRIGRVRASTLRELCRALAITFVSSPKDTHWS